MTNQEYVWAFQLLKDSLYENYAVYHERVTLLIQLTVFEIAEDRVRFNAKIIKPLNKSYAEDNRLYHAMMAKEEISFGAGYLFGGADNTLLLKGTKVGRPYCPFILWLDPELARFVLQNNDEITCQIPNYILWSEDWRILADKPTALTRQA